MKKLLLILICLFSVSSFLFAEPQPVNYTFSPPKGWKTAQQKDLPENFFLIVKGTSLFSVPPSISLAVEATDKSLDDYVNFIISINDTTNSRVKLLPDLITRSGKAKLIEIRETSQYGEVIFLQAFLIKNEQAFILTATALKKEQAKFRSSFIKSFRSLRLD